MWRHISGEGLLFTRQGCQGVCEGVSGKDGLSSPEDQAYEAGKFLWVRGVYDAHAISLEFSTGRQNLCCACKWPLIRCPWLMKWASRCRAIMIPRSCAPDACIARALCLAGTRHVAQVPTLPFFFFCTKRDKIIIIIIKLRILLRLCGVNDIILPCPFSHFPHSYIYTTLGFFFPLISSIHTIFTSPEMRENASTKKLHNEE